MSATARLASLALVGVMLGGCSEVGFQDMFGAGKYIPNESQVSQGHVLSTPPDLQLRPPANGEQPVQQASQPPQPMTEPPAQQTAIQNQAPVYQPQQAYQAPTPQPVYQQPQQVNQGPQQLQPQQTQQQATNDPYAKWGVSQYKPDGNKKTQAELNEEMRKKRLEIEKAKNPNYGTIFNLGSIWTDG